MFRKFVHRLVQECLHKSARFLFGLLRIFYRKFNHRFFWSFLHRTVSSTDAIKNFPKNFLWFLQIFLTIFTVFWESCTPQFPSLILPEILLENKSGFFRRSPQKIIPGISLETISKTRWQFSSGIFLQIYFFFLQRLFKYISGTPPKISQEFFNGNSFKNSFGIYFRESYGKYSLNIQYRKFVLQKLSHKYLCYFLERIPPYILLKIPS